MECCKSSLKKSLQANRSLAAGTLIVLLILAILNLNLIISPVHGGTETGEFCCTCPDYANFDAWLAKKAQICDNAGNIITPESKPSNGGNPATVSPPIPYAEPQFITSPASKLDGFVIIDVRTPEEYAKGHIQGSRNLDWAAMQSKGDLDSTSMERALQKIGVNDSDPLLIYGGNDEGASYVFWALSYLGHKNLSKMDGGIADAVKAGQILVKSSPLTKESNYTSHIVTNLLVKESDLGRWLNRTDVQILDARDFAEFGQAKLTDAALPLDAPKLYGDDFKIKDAKTLDDILGRRLDKNKTQLIYGTPAAYSLFYALKLMGYNATILEGNWWKESKWAISNVR